MPARGLGSYRCFLVGHSDGGTITLAYAGLGLPARAIIALAAHIRDDDKTVEVIRSSTQAG